MTKRHFIALADMVRKLDKGYLGGTVDYAELLTGLVEFCQQANPRFNRERWLGYIAGENGPSGGKGGGSRANGRSEGTVRN